MRKWDGSGGFIRCAAFFVRYCYSYFFLNCRWPPGGEVRLHYLEFGMCGRCGRGIGGALYNMGSGIMEIGVKEYLYMGLFSFGSE